MLLLIRDTQRALWLTLARNMINKARCCSYMNDNGTAPACRESRHEYAGAEAQEETAVPLSTG